MYPDFLKRHGRVLPLARLAAANEAAILTAASYEAVAAFLDLSGLRGIRILGYSCTRQQKAHLLKNILDGRKDVLYFDDDPAEAKALHGLSGVACVGVSFPGVY
jgi:hypothetical protein